MAGSIGALAGLLICYPFDVAKTILQTQRPGASRYRGTLHCLVTVAREQGILGGLYRGIESAMVMAVVSTATYFWFYTWFKRVALGIGDQHHNNDGGRTASASEAERRRSLGITFQLAVGAAAGACNQILTLPIGTVTTRVQIQGGAAAGTLLGPAAMLLHILRREGVLTLWRGLLPSLMLVCNPSLTFLALEGITVVMRRRNIAALVATLQDAVNRAEESRRPGPGPGTPTVPTPIGDRVQTPATSSIGDGDEAPTPPALPGSALPASGQPGGGRSGTWPGQQPSSARQQRSFFARADTVTDLASLPGMVSAVRTLSGRIGANAAAYRGASGAVFDEAEQLQRRLRALAAPPAAPAAAAGGGGGGDGDAALRDCSVRRAAELTAPQSFVAGAVAKFVAIVCTYPLILSKARLQWRGPNGESYSSVLAVLVTAVREDGPLGVFNGMAAQLYKAVVNFGVLYATKQHALRAVLSLWAALAAARGRRGSGGGEQAPEPA